MSTSAPSSCCSSRLHSQPPRWYGDADIEPESLDDSEPAYEPAPSDDRKCASPQSVDRALEAEGRLIRQEYKDQAERSRDRQFRRNACEYEREIDGRPDLASFDLQRFLDPTQFDFRLRHRARLSPWLQDRYRCVAAKLCHRSRNGDWGYFRELVENGIDYKSEIGVIASIRQPWADAVCRCGIWTKGFGSRKNSGRCHEHSFCRLCAWMDYGRLMQESYGARTRTFSRAVSVGQRFFIIHLSIRDNPQNARAIGRDLCDADLDMLKAEDGLYSEYYESRPVYIGGTHGEDDTPGLRTCQYVSLACMQSLRVVYRRKLIRGLKAKLETALLLVPTRALPHLHALATADLAIEPQFLAEELKAEMDAVLQKHAGQLQIPLYASVRVFAIKCPDHLERAALYIEKPIPTGLLVQEALSRDEARDSDGNLNVEFLDQLEHGLANLYDQVDAISRGFKAYAPEFSGVRSRLSLGNLVYGRKDCIPAEPKWHRERRIKHADIERQRRAKKKRAQKEGIEAPAKRRPFRKRKRTRKSNKEQILARLIAPSPEHASSDAAKQRATQEDSGTGQDTDSAVIDLQTASSAEARRPQPDPDSRVQGSRPPPTRKAHLRNAALALRAHAQGTPPPATRPGTSSSSSATVVDDNTARAGKQPPGSSHDPNLSRYAGNRERGESCASTTCSQPTTHDPGTALNARAAREPSPPPPKLRPALSDDKVSPLDGDNEICQQ